jgi:hypothetical protein
MGKRLTASDIVGIRTQDPYIKSVLLYQLSYDIIILKNYFSLVISNLECKDNYILFSAKCFCN